ncbi:MAG: autotransporter outer membrane beta-barrel domain-containing protein [Phycisphaeraceae bacterium]
MDTTSERSGLKATTGGFIVGADYTINENIFVGLSGGYAITDISFRESRGDGDIHSFRVGPYVGMTFDRLFIDASAAYSYHDNEYDQDVNIGGFNETKESSFDAHDISLHVSAGYNHLLANRQTSIIPIASLDYIHYDRDGFTESGAGPANFEVDSQTVDSLELTVGARIEHRYYTDGPTIIPSAFLGYSYEFLDEDNDVTARFVGAPDSFTLAGPGADQHAVRVGAGVRALMSESFQAHVQYDGRFQSNQNAHALHAGIGFQF